MNKIKVFFRKLWYYNFTIDGLEEQRQIMIQQRCNHKHWNCDNQIRVIICKDCGKKAWIDDYIDITKEVKSRIKISK